MQIKALLFLSLKNFNGLICFLGLDGFTFSFMLYSPFPALHRALGHLPAFCDGNLVAAFHDMDFKAIFTEDCVRITDPCMLINVRVIAAEDHANLSVH